jgi:PAS domain S-box-containing protein
MSEQTNTNPDLIAENALLKKRIRKLEKLESERKQMEDALRKSEANYRQLFENSPTAIYQIDFRTGKFSKANDVFCEYLGYSHEEITSITAFDILSEESQQAFLSRISKIASGEKVQEHPEYEIISRNGQRTWVQLNTKYIYDSEGRISGADVVAHDITRRKQDEKELQRAHHELEERVADRTKELMRLNQELQTEITERKRAEEALRESQRRLSDIVEFLPDATLVIDKKGNVIAWNRAIEEMTGIQSADMIGKGNFEYALPFYNERRWLLADRALEFHEHTDRKHDLARREENHLFEEGEVPMLKGEARFLSRRAAAIFSTSGEVVGAIESIRDITEQKLIEKAFAAEHKKLSLVLDGSPVSTFVIDRDTRVTEWNLVNEYFTGISKKSVIGKPIDLQPIFKDKAPLTLAELVLEMTDEEIIECYADKGVRKSVIHPEAFETVGSIWIKGKEHIMAIQATRLRDAEGNVIGAIQCAEDVTEQKRFEEALSASEEQYRTILENIEDGYFEVDLGGNLTFFNDSLSRLNGYPPAEMMGANYRHYTDNENSQILYQAFNTVFTSGEPLKGVEYEIIGKDGTKRTVEASVSPMRNASGQPTGFRGIIRNITERKRAERERYHYEKLQGVLEMAGAICHELNQPMQTISGYAEVILMNTSENDPLYMKLDMISRQIRRMGDITKKLMTIDDYKTQDYAGFGRIVDIHKSSAVDSE